MKSLGLISRKKLHGMQKVQVFPILMRRPAVSRCRTPNPGTHGPPQVTFDLPDGIDITHPTDIHGTVSTGPYVLEFARGSEDDTSLNFQVIKTGSAPIDNGLLGTFDPTNLLNGGYVIRLISTDASGQKRI